MGLPGLRIVSVYVPPEPPGPATVNIGQKGLSDDEKQASDVRKDQKGDFMVEVVAICDLLGVLWALGRFFFCAAWRRRSSGEGARDFA